MTKCLEKLTAEEEKARSSDSVKAVSEEEKRREAILCVYSCIL